MKRIILALAVVASTARAQSAIDHETARKYFRQLSDLGARDGGKLWGIRVNGPMMFVDPSTGDIVANEADTQNLLHLTDGLWMGTLPKTMSPANTAVDFGGKRFSMIMWPLSENKYSRGRLLMHESFHRIQDKLGLPGSNPSNNHLATADGRIWTRLEWRALTEALFLKGEARREAIADALTFRARRTLGNPVATAEEGQLEINEGLAEYTGLRLSGLPASVLADRAAIALAQNESQESLVRSFAYTSGPAYGVLLDQSGKAWRNQLRSTPDLSELTRRAYQIYIIDPQRADRLIAKYDGAAMVASERAREAKRLANEKRLRTIFADSAVLRLPVMSGFSYSFNPNTVTPFPGMGTIYGTARITDSWGALEVDGGDVLMARNSSGIITAVIAAFPTVNGEEVTGKGWKLTLRDGWTVGTGSRSGELIVMKKE